MGDTVDNLWVKPGNHLELGHFYGSIEQVDSWVIVERGAIFDAPQLTRIGSALIYEGGQFRVPQLVSIGDLGVIGAKITLPKLARVRGRLDVDRGAVVDAPVLARVARLVVSDGTVFVPALSAPGEYLRVGEGAVLVGPRGVRGQPGDTWSNLWRRVGLASVTSPHGRCDRSAHCVEHALNSTVLSCKRRGRFSKES